MSDADYVTLLTRADSAMSAHQDRLQRDFRLGAWPRFDYDEGAGVLVFSEHDTARIVADVEFVGDVNRRDSTWTWAWDVPSYTRIRGQHGRRAVMGGFMAYSNSETVRGMAMTSTDGR